MILQGLDPRKANRGVTTAPVAVVRDLVQIGLARTPESTCAVRVYSVNDAKFCAAVLGSRDVRVFQADHKPPTSFDLQYVDIKPTRSVDAFGFQIQRRGLLRRIAFSLCCCEPFVHSFKVPRTEQLAAKRFLEKACPGVYDEAGADRLNSHVELTRVNSGRTQTFFLQDLPDNAFHALAAFLLSCNVHEMMRVNSVLRSRFVEEQFWHGIYYNHLPKHIRDMIEEFEDVHNKSYMDKVSVAHLRFCNNCFARRTSVELCLCGCDSSFGSFVRFDLRSYELRRLGLLELNVELRTFGLDLKTAELCYSTRYNGFSLQQMLLRASAEGRYSHILVCECLDGQIFGAFLGFPLRRLSSRAYGTANCFLFDLGSLREPRWRIFHHPTEVSAAPVTSVYGQFSFGMDGDVVIGLTDDLRSATCEASPWCGDIAISYHTAALRSVSLFSWTKKHGSTSGKLSYNLQDGGEQADAGAQLDALLLDLVCTSYLKDYFA
eukprot:TRINITY_DN21739_c0_g1_i1.p1 TRINITY_DN21739_c0_g1~~TRINITY_DN21739_c0_g1_i1.p1  ORF type:complete len:490 (+),score=49.25 TRINITY_DN21739_c0_g1_i1:100-1569(+)